MHVTAASYGENDGSAIRRRIEDGVDTFLDLHLVDDVEATQRMASLCPDVVVDLMAHTRGARTALAASKPHGCVLVNYLG